MLVLLDTLETELEPMDVPLFVLQLAKMEVFALNQTHALAQTDTVEIHANLMEVEELLFYSASL